MNFEDDYGGDNQFHGFFEFTFRRFFDDCYHLEDLRAAARAEAEREKEQGEEGKGGGGKERGSGRGSNGGPVYV